MMQTQTHKSDLAFSNLYLKKRAEIKILYQFQKTKTEFFVAKADARNFEHEIKKQLDFDSIIKFAQQQFPNFAEHVIPRLKQLKDFVDEEIAEGEDVSLSLPSLKNLFVFLYALKTFKKPTITVGDDGLFQVDWEIDKFNVLTIRFDEAFYVSYVIFRPSQYESRRIILNGSMYVLDFKNYLLELKLTTHKKTND